MYMYNKTNKSCMYMEHAYMQPCTVSFIYRV